MKITLSESMLRLTNAAPASPGTTRRKGSFLIEASVSLFVLVAVAVVLMNSSFNILQPRSWTMKQNLVDAYLSGEVAEMNALDFDAIANGTSGWGTGAVYGSAATLTAAVTVPLGELPGFTAGVDNGRPYSGDLRRQLTIIEGSTAIPPFKNTVTSGGQVSLADLGVRAYKLQSHVAYTIDSKTFIKSRTVIRSE